MWSQNGRAAVIAFLILSLVILLILWFVTPVFTMAMFLWLLFSFAIMILMVWNGETSALSYIFVLVFTFPVLFIVLGAFFWYAAK